MFNHDDFEDCFTAVIKNAFFTETKTCLGEENALNYAKQYVARATKRSSATVDDFEITVRPATRGEIGRFAATAMRLASRREA